MANNKKVTVDDLTTVANAITEKSDARFRKSADKLAKTDLTSELKTEIEGKAAASDVYAKSETYTKQEVNDAIAASASSAYKGAGSKAAADMTSDLLVKANEGKVYNLSDELKITAENKALFTENTEGSYPSGTNIAVINTGDTENPAYKFDVLAGFVDLSGYATTSDVEVASAADIQAIVDGLYASGSGES